MLSGLAPKGSAEEPSTDSTGAPSIASPDEGPPVPSTEGAAPRADVSIDTLESSLHAPLDSLTAWSLTSFRLASYAPRSLGDAAAVLPLAHADRFGPPAYFETIRPGGTGSPVVVADGIVWPRDAGGLVNTGAMPRAGVTRFSLATPRLLPELALAAPGGVVLLEGEPWEGGSPRSFVAAERGADGYRDYRFGFARDLPRRLALEADGQFRKADAFTVDSYRAFSSRLRLQARVRPDVVVRAGFRRYGDEQFLLDTTLRNRFSHEATDKRDVLLAELFAPGLIGQAYRTRLHSDANAAAEAYASTAVSDDRSGVRLSSGRRLAGSRLAISVRGEKRKAEADGRTREAWTASLGAGAERDLAGAGRGALAFVGETAEGEKGRASGEASISWRGPIPGILRAGRAWEGRTTRGWIEQEGEPGVVRYGEVAVRPSFLPAPVRPEVRYFRREGDRVDYLYSVDAFQESGMRIDERTEGVEVSVEGAAGALEWGGAYAWTRAREKGKTDLLPYQSDHLVRGRLSYAHAIPYVPAVPRADLLGEWRSDRRAPGRSVPMEDYFYLRGRVTVKLRGTDLFAQMEQVLGHQNEFIDGPVEGTDGVLSGSRQIYLGLSWPFTD